MLFHAIFMPNVSIAPGEFFAHIGKKWNCVEDTSSGVIKKSNFGTFSTGRFQKSIVFIADCKSVKQLTSYLVTMPGAGISNVKIFPVPEMVEYQ